MPNPSIVFRKNVDELAHKNGLSQRQLAIAIGMDPSGFSRLLKGANDPSMETVGKLAEVLGVPAFYLLMSPEDRARWDSLQSAAPVDVVKRLEAVERDVKRLREDPEVEKYLEMGREIGARDAATARGKKKA